MSLKTFDLKGLSLSAYFSYDTITTGDLNFLHVCVDFRMMMMMIGVVAVVIIQ